MASLLGGGRERPGGGGLPEEIFIEIVVVLPGHFAQYFSVGLPAKNRPQAPEHWDGHHSLNVLVAICGGCGHCTQALRGNRLEVFEPPLLRDMSRQLGDMCGR